MKILNSLIYLFCLTTLFMYVTYGDNSEPTTTTVPPHAMLKWEDSNKTYMFYPDEISKTGQIDLFYDRIVPIAYFERKGYETFTIIAIGVVLDENRVLTSYNPFRKIINHRSIMTKVKVVFMSSRKTYEADDIVRYYGSFSRYISCARCVIPLLDRQMSFEQWHDPFQKHSPVHDLMILRTDYPIRLGDVGNTTIGVDDEQHETTVVEAGPILTTLADSKNHIGKELYLASIGLTNYEPISKYRTLIYANLSLDDIVDCNSWLPKNWGYFICFKNPPTFIGFASSAMLFYNETLYGVGSFTIWRGSISVLVFTDVRPYSNLINNTCTEEDVQVLYRAHG